MRSEQAVFQPTPGRPALPGLVWRHALTKVLSVNNPAHKEEPPDFGRFLFLPSNFLTRWRQPAGGAWRRAQARQIQ